MKSTYTHTCYSSWSHPIPDKEYFQQGSRKQNLFAFLHSTFNALLSFVPVGIFPYFILFLLSLSERDFHWNSCSQGPAPMQGQKIIGDLFTQQFYLSFLPSLPPPPLPPLALDWSWSLQDNSCLLCISIANEIEEKEVELQCVEPQACSLGRERADQHADQVLPRNYGTRRSWQWGTDTAVVVFSRYINIFCWIFNMILADLVTSDQWALDIKSFHGSAILG